MKQQQAASLDEVQKRRAKFAQRSVEDVLGKCPGCGAAFQSHDEQAPGYIAEDQTPKAVREARQSGGRMSLEEEIELLMGEQNIEEEDAATVHSAGVYRVIANVFLDIRKEPDINSERTGEHVMFSETVQVSEVRAGDDGRTYFKLANGKGWLFDWAVVDGEHTVLLEKDAGTSRVSQMKTRDVSSIVCERCWQLSTYNDCDDCHRPAHINASKDLAPEKFEKMLTQTLQHTSGRALILAVVDIFDFGPSFRLLEYLARELKGKPHQFTVKIIFNKIDLFPDQVNPLRLQTWVMRSAKRAGLGRLRLSDILPVSCHKTYGIGAISRLLDDPEMPRTFFLVGAANTGKSSLLNRLIMRKRKGVGGKASYLQEGFTVSVLPGTTLSAMTVKYRQGPTSGRRLVDTPGLLVEGNFHDLLPMRDLNALVPQFGTSQRITVTLAEGKSWLIGGLARIDFVEGRQFQFTAFTSDSVKLHLCKTEKAEETLTRLGGTKLTPPLTKETFDGFGPWRSQQFSVNGKGWSEACGDIVLPGVGFVSITGVGKGTFSVHVPEGIDTYVRPESLMPYEAKWTGVKAKSPGVYQVGAKTRTASKKHGNRRERSNNRVLKRLW